MPCRRMVLDGKPLILDGYTSETYTLLMVFVESPWFSAWRKDHLDDEDFRALQIALLQHPARGAVIQGSGGLRKIRVAAAGHGKRGGGRVIYFYQTKADRIYLLAGFTKAKQADLSPAQARSLARAMKEELNHG